MNIKKLLGKRIKEIRKSKNYTQEQIAEFVGFDTASLSNIETGKYYPTAENLEKIILALGITPEDLFIIEHHKDESELLAEINSMLRAHPDRIQDVYKMLKGLLR